MMSRKLNLGRTGKFRVEKPPTLTSDIIIFKIIQHSRDCSSPRLLKYIVQAKKTFSSSNIKLWMDLRTKGGLHAIETVVRNCVDANGLPNSVDNLPGALSLVRIQQDIFSNGLSLLGNSYSLDYAARKDVATNGFIEVIHRLIQTTESNVKNQSDPSENKELFSVSECDIITKSLKCVANLAVDSGCRDIILKSGIGLSIIKLLDRFNTNFSDDVLKDTEGKSSSVAFRDEYKECVRSAVRAIRILSSEPFCSEEGKTHLIRFGAVVTIGKILCWGHLSRQDDLILDVMRALASLTDRIRLLPSDQIEELASEEMGNITLKKIIATFDYSTVQMKLYTSTIRCLTNLSYNKHIAEALGRLLVFKVALQKLKQTSGKLSSEICRLLVTLTKHSMTNQYVLNNCQEVWSTLNILKCNDLKEYHRWLLHVYENVYEGSLKALLKNGLVELIHDHLKEELEDCDYEILKNKVVSLDDVMCRVHTSGIGCPFIPVYRCNSPSYQQVQEEFKVLLMGRDIQSRMDGESSSSGIDSSSPSSSPARSWTSDDSGLDLGIPRVMYTASQSSSISDDEGCYSPVYSQLSLSPTYSETTPEKNASIDESHNVLLNQLNDSSQRSKYPKLELDCLNTAPPPYDEKLHHGSKRSDNVKSKSKKIVSMLNILHKTTFLSPMPPSLVTTVPILLSFIVRGIVSLTPQRQKYEDISKDLESRRLGRQSFSLAYRILKAMSLNIHFFPEFVRNGTIAMVSRLLPWDKALIDLGNGQSISNLLDTLSGKSNDTAGWREGYLLRTLLISKCEDELNKIALTIPLLFRKNNHVLRNFETKGSSWTHVFELLTKADEISLSLFQDCILSISTLSETIGMKYDSLDLKHRQRLLKFQGEQSIDNFIKFIDNDQDHHPREGRVEVVLDDGTSALVLKTVLTEASPVFLAMFEGHFIEAGSQKVRIRNISKEALVALIEQLQTDFTSSSTDIAHEVSNTISISESDYELSTLFELISLSDQFLLETIYERTLNTLLCYYICPYSAPEIYREAVKLSGLAKPQSRLKGWDMDLTFIILKYLLVGDINVNSRCCAFRKIFDTVPHHSVVGDMRALIEYYSTRPQSSK